MRPRIIGAFVAMTAIWGASFLWIKIAVLDIGPFSLVLYRLAFAVAGLLPILIWRRPEMPHGAATWRAIILVGVLTTTAPWLFISWAEQTIDSALATVLNATVPLFTVLIAHFALKDDRMTTWRVVGLLFGFAGVVVLSRSGSGESGRESHLLGVLAMMASGMCYTVGTVIARRSLRHLSSLAQAFYSVAVAAVLLWAAARLCPVGSVCRAAILSGSRWSGSVFLGRVSHLFFSSLCCIGWVRHVRRSLPT